ncbi:hypothetical protein WJX72_007725 [[Myrmecia] bisecta]|uniref:Uncharacterized protein n=1 Tax=[Myrmecia] bisecta TaxID=41462 RepID=A0AAW1PQG4_9CHLO
MIRRFREAPPRSRADRQRLASVRASLEAGPSPVAEGSTDQFWWQQEASSGMAGQAGRAGAAAWGWQA